MSEKTDYQIMRKRLIQGHDRIERIENIVGIGTPDVNYCIDGVEGWIEMKSPKEPKREKSKLFKFKNNHEFTQGQKNWFLKQRNAGGRAFVLICTDKRWMLMDIWQADFINEMTVDQLWHKAVWACSKPVIRCQWNKLREVLCDK